MLQDLPISFYFADIWRKYAN